MSKFEPTASKKVLLNEGLYANSKLDTGGETWRGLSRNNEPNWPGFAIMDRIKKKNPSAVKLFETKGDASELNKLFVADPDLDKLVIPFYQKRYWDVNRLDEVKDQQLADNVCDCGVNCGTGTASRMLQRAAAEVSGKTLAIDGKIGPATLALVNQLNAEVLFNKYNQFRKEYYEGIITRNPSQAVWRKSWMSRIVPYKK